MSSWYRYGIIPIIVALIALWISDGTMVPIEQVPGAQIAAHTAMQDLHKLCSESLNQSFESKFDPFNNASYALLKDLENWGSALEGRKESFLYVTATQEFVLSFLSTCQ